MVHGKSIIMVTKLWWSHKNELSFNKPSHMILSKCIKPQERKERLCGTIVRRNLIIFIDMERPIAIVKKPCLAGDSGLSTVDWKLAEPCSRNIHSCPPPPRFKCECSLTCCFKLLPHSFLCNDGLLKPETVRESKAFQSHRAFVSSLLKQQENK